MKTYTLKIYDTAGNYLRTITPSVIMSGVSFSAQIAGWQGEMRVKLNLPFQSVLINYNQIVKVYESDEATPNGRQIYTGIVGSFQRVNESGAEYIELRALGLASMLSWNYYKSGANYAFSKNQDPSATIREIVDSFSVNFPGLITYDANSIENTGITSNLSFSYNKQNEAAKTVSETATNWWWYIDGLGKFNFHPKTGAIGQLHHKIDMDYDIDSIKVEENLEKLVNTYILDYSSGTVTATDATSIANYGTRTLHDSKTDIGNATTANATAAAYIAANKDPIRKISITVKSVYDIESIRPGDLVTVRNFNYDISALQINRIQYNPESITLELEDITSLAKEIFTT